MVNASYELGGRITGDRIVAFKGRRADGVMVLMHQLTSGLDHSGVLKLAIAYMLRYPPANGGRILDQVELDGLTYLVTVDEPGCLELSEWLSREVGHAGAAETGVTAERPAADPKPAESFRTSQPGFAPFFGAIQSTSGALSPPQRSGPSVQKPVVAFTAFSEPPPRAPAAMPLEPPPAGPSTPPTGGSGAASDPVAAPGIAVPTFGAAQEAAAPPATYLLVQQKAGPLKTVAFTLMGFLVVAALFWIAILVVRGMG